MKKTEEPSQSKYLSAPLTSAKHDINNALTGVLLSTEILKKKLDKEKKYSEHIKRLEKSISSLRAKIENLRTQ